jgi:hypothetical protein
MSLQDPCGMQREKHGEYQGQNSRSRQCPTRERVNAIYLLFQNAGTRSPRIKQVRMFCCWDRTTKQDKTREDKTRPDRTGDWVHGLPSHRTHGIGEKTFHIEDCQAT